MKTLIVYMSHHGTTEKASGILKQELGDQNIDLINLRKDTVPALEQYDTIVVGGSIHAGMIQKRIKKFCEVNGSLLKGKKAGYFICCMERGEKKIQQLESSYPKELRDSAVALGVFGGEFVFDRMNFIERAIIKKISGVSQSVSDIDYEAIKKFAADIKNA